MFRKIALTAASVLVLSGGVALAEGAEQHIEDVAFAHEGPFSRFDQFQLQRGLQVFTEVCAGCHGLKYVPIRTLSDAGGPGIPEDQVRAYAKAFTVYDEESNRALLWDSVKGEMRPLKATDNFPINTAAGAPDLSLMAKSRAGFHGPYGTGINQLFRGMGGPEYLVSLLTGYTGEEKTEFGATLYENTAFPGGWIAMSPPLSDGQVTYADGHDNSTHHMAEDVASFLMWAAEPNMMARKNAGFVSVIFLLILSTLLYLTNKQIWAGIKNKKHA